MSYQHGSAIARLNSSGVVNNAEEKYQESAKVGRGGGQRQLEPPNTSFDHLERKDGGYYLT